MAYSEDQVAEALAVLATSETMTAAQRVLKGRWGKAPHHATLARWQDQASKNPERDGSIAEKARDKKAELADAFERLARRILGRVTDDKIDQALLHQMTTAAGTAIDKMRLLREESTAITETRNHEEHRDIIAERLARLRSAPAIPEQN